ncbi:unnamed protein product [Sympodiomycopsis kandeliae]
MAPTIDDELLALAGGLSDSGQEDNTPASSSRRKAKTASAPRKKRKVEDASGSNDEDDDDDEREDDDGNVGAASYPVEGVYKSWDDKQRIEDMSLIERESILAQRRDEILSRERTAQLAGMVAAQQGKRGAKSGGSKTKTRGFSRGPDAKRAAAADSDMDESDDEEDDDDDDDADDDDDDDDENAYDGPASGRGARKIKSVGSSDTRNKKLQELSENRRQKAKAASRKKASSSSDRSSPRKPRTSSGDDSDEESEESEGYVGSDDEYGGRRGGRRGAGSGARRGGSRFDSGPFVPPTLEDVNRARIGREDILKIMYRKGWEDKLIGSFVRVVVDPKRNEANGQMIPRYRAYEIIDWKKGSKWYQADQGKYTQLLLVLSFAKEKHYKEIIYVSNSNITPEEFARYQSQSQESSNRSSKEEIIEQAENFSDFVNEQWTEDTFAHVLKMKQEAKKLAQQAPSAQNGSYRSSNGTSTPTTSEDAPKTEDVLLAELNERNRKADRERIQEANRRQAEMRRAAAIAQAQAAQARAQKDKLAAAASDEASTSASASNANDAPHSLDPTSSSKKKAAPVSVEIDLGDF